jgi:site-specific DNA-methyltransferase (adenine-specific)
MTARWTLHHGEALAWLASLPTGSADALITDPPYSSGGFTRGDRAATTDTKYTRSDTQDRDADFGGDNRDQRGYLAWCTLWLSECLRVLRPGGVVALFTDWRQLPTTTDALQCGGFVWRGVAPWIKPAPRPCLGRFAASSEFVVWGSAGPMGERPEVGCLPGHCVHHQARADRHHQTGKPTAVMEWVVGISTPGGHVIDPFAGSGTTGVAAVLTGRTFAGCEMSEHYHRVASERLHAAAHGVRLARDDTRTDATQTHMFKPDTP